MPPTWNPDAVVLHLSDLHFSGYLQNVHGEGEWSKFARPHDFGLLLEVESHVRPLLERWHERTIVVVTGDLTTAAEPPAYEIAATYLRGMVWVNDRTKVGLALVDQYHMEERLLVVPGNHDTWLYGPLFTQWRRYSDRRALYRQYFARTYERLVYPLVAGGISFLFFLLDSNEVQAFNPLNCRNVLGQGRVGLPQIRQVQADYNQFGTSSTKRPDGFDLGSAVRIGVLHHHPALPEGHPDSLGGRLLELQDAEDVMALFRHPLEARLVLCGHQHYPYVCPSGPADEGWPRVSCAGSATQRERSINSFKVYWIRRNDHGTVIEMEEYRRQKRRGPSKFAPQPRVAM